ncbi:MAG TPA: hypothetical protein DCE41_19785 [Cytophagales bacterium]|nr:hypothetical protein [Cytophagales bacterium]HAA19370.1 hypothetical protein [Cytophagales bacterium]HAP64948.1 hypothetical protein [Cytophagales bacterium]
MAYDFENLVIKGGGVRGTVYLGALEVLSQRGILSNIKRVAGSSAGALSALLVALFKDDWNTLNQQARSLHYPSVPDRPRSTDFDPPSMGKQIRDLYYPRGSFKAGLDSLVKGKIRDEPEKGSVRLLLHRYGLYTTHYIRQWVLDQLGKKNKLSHTNYSETTTFRQLRSEGIELSITMTNLPLSQPMICNHFGQQNENLDVRVVDAVVASMSIPLFFTPLVIQGGYYKGVWVDGGMMNNFPITLYDNPDGTPNGKTLGLFVYSKTRAVKENYWIKDYLGGMVFSLLEAQDYAFHSRPQDVKRTIQIDDTGVSAVDFDITQNDSRYQKMVESGKKSANEYLDGLGSVPS